MGSIDRLYTADQLRMDIETYNAGQGGDCREAVDGSKTMYCKRHAAAMETQIAAMARPQLSEHHIASALRGFKPNTQSTGPARTPARMFRGCLGSVGVLVLHQCCYYCCCCCCCCSYHCRPETNHLGHRPCAVTLMAQQAKAGCMPWA